ncbi:MAG: efflux RND transporter periplasmic adaptor subunit [Acidobacteria bacterium]|nr:efflux RND transporter periplasmic adaptor subunit [Acidobacteriota bacterium]
MARRKSRKFLLLTTIVILIVIAGAYTVSIMSRPVSDIDPSRLALVERGDLARSVVAVGRIEPVAKVEIKSKANGIIKEAKVEVGDLVNEGQVLVELDKENLAARLREARAALLGAEANAKAAQAELEKNRIEAEDIDVSFARRNLGRAEQLSKDGLIPQQSLDDARLALEVAENRQRAAQTQLSVTQARVAQAQATVAQAQATVERAEEELNNATIRSPIKGMVLSRDVEIGSPVSSILNMGAGATLVMVLGDIREVFVRGKVDEADIGLVKREQPARIKVETFRERQFQGRVTQISPLGVEKDNVISFEVKVSIDNASGELRANMSANAEIVLEEHKGTLVVPEKAIIYDTQRAAWIEVPAPGTPTGKERKQVQIGISNGTRTEIVQGLTEGQKVILQ